MTLVRCPQCETEVQSETVICPSCGKRLDIEATGDAAATADDSRQDASPPPASTPGARIRQAVRSNAADDDDAERELWQGGYSPKAMYGTWIATAIATVAALIVGALYATSGMTWGIMLGVIALVWAAEGLLLLYRRMNVHYRLTTQRFFHERGVLSRSTDRIEVIDMDDVTAKQGPIERIFGVGTIEVISSDSTHPKFYIKGIADVRNVYDKLDTARRNERMRRGLHIEAV